MRNDVSSHAIEFAKPNCFHLWLIGAGKYHGLSSEVTSLGKWLPQATLRRLTLYGVASVELKYRVRHL